MNILSIVAPNRGAFITTQYVQNQTIKLDFDVSDATFDRSESNLVINFTNGGSVIVDDFLFQIVMSYHRLSYLTEQKFQVLIFSKV